ncbi:MAG: aminomethyl transferase family protein [Herpetosiphonaceae bacterium]|nr:aminomethyl transferase family protein [Herpetosiphonaceae bacterium]
MTSAPHSLAEAHPEAYQAARDGVVRYDASACGRLRMLGRDRAELLHRLSTNDVRSLTAGMGLRTVLTNHNARIIDLLTVYALPEHLLLVTSPGQGTPIRKLLARNIFFNDKVTIEAITDHTVQWQLYGPQAATLLQKLTGLPVGEWALHHIQATQIAGAGAWVARTLPLGDTSSPAFTIFALQADWLEIAPRFEDLPTLDEATYQVLRIEAGYPAWQHELSLDYIPLETRLRDAVSFTKGCYIGQEIIARMDSRQRLAKQLMRLRLDTPVEVGVKLQLDGKEQGTLTSIAHSPEQGLIGLGYIRTEHAHPGVSLQAGTAHAEVEELPGG